MQPTTKPRLILALLLVLSQPAGAWASALAVHLDAGRHQAASAQSIGAMDCEHADKSCCNGDDACDIVCTIACAATAHALIAESAPVRAPVALVVPTADTQAPTPPHLRALIRPPRPSSC